MTSINICNKKFLLVHTLICSYRFKNISNSFHLPLLILGKSLSSNMKKSKDLVMELMVK